MSERVQLEYALVDVNFFDKPKVIALMARHHYVSALVMLQVIMTLSTATDAKMDVYAAYGLGLKFGIDLEKSKEIINYCIKEGMFELDGDVITQRRVAEDQERLALKRKRNAEAQEKIRAKKLISNTLRNDDVIHDVSNDKTILPVTVTVTDSININNKTVKLPEATDPSPYPPKINPDDPLSKWLPDAYSQFDQNSPVCITSGRRQMRQYPEIWIAPHELAEVFRQMELKIPSEEWRSVFQKVKVWATGKVSEGMNPKRINTASALMGWALTEVVDAHTKDLRLQKTKAR